MQINRRITNGLAWAGLFIVVAVPVADAISAQLMGDKDRIAVASVAAIKAPIPAPLSQRPSAPAARPVMETAAVVPAKPAVVPVVKPVVASSPVVDSFLSSGKKLPSYITGADDEPEQAAVTPAPATPAIAKPVAATPPVETVATVPTTPVAPAEPVAIDPVEVATLTPTKTAPTPMPLSMRPAPMANAQPVVDEEIVLPPAMVARNAQRQRQVVDDLEDWESGPLSDYLAERQGQSSATVTQDDGYFLSDRPSVRPRRDVYVGPVEDEVFFPFMN